MSQDRSHPLIRAGECLQKAGLSEQDIEAYFELGTVGRVRLQNLEPHYEPIVDRLLKERLATLHNGTLGIASPEKFWTAQDQTPQLLKRVRSPYQTIELYQQNDEVFLTLNGCIQYHSQEIARSHELMVGLPLCLAAEAKSVLILGGGDGFAAAEALRHPSVERVRMVELDPKMIELHSEHPRLLELNKRALLDPRVEVIGGDALAHFMNLDETFDVVIDDCEFLVGSQPDDTIEYYLSYFKALASKLSPGGVGSVMEPIEPEFLDGRALFLPKLLANRPEQTRPQTIRGQIKLMMSLLWPHTSFVEFQCLSLGLEMYTYFSQSEIGRVRRPAPQGSVVLKEALEQMGSKKTPSRTNSESQIG